MNNGMRELKKILIAAFSSSVFVLFLVPLSSADMLLSLPNTAQEHSNWCWDASSRAIMKYYGTDVSQCTIANWVFSRNDCCGNSFFYWETSPNISHPCNNGNFLSEIERSRSIQGVLGTWGGLSTFAQWAPLSQATCVSEVNAGRPFVLRFDWKPLGQNKGAHALVGYGYDLNGQYLDYMDPWPGNGYTKSLYSWVVESSDHLWTQTLKNMTNPKPTVTTTNTSSISASTASLNGSVNANNSITTASFEYGATTSYGSTVTADQSPVTGSTSVAVSKSIVGLAPNTLYHFRVKASNSVGTSYGADLNFTTASIFTLTVMKLGTGAGSIISSSLPSPVVNCDTTCSYSFLQNTPVTLTATPHPGNIFIGWSGACSGKGSCSVTMNSPHSVTATFVPDITTILNLLLND